ncbi:MAG: endolytic transglycosylase MltG [Candidatus Paceibacterota bacterium]
MEDEFIIENPSETDNSFFNKEKNSQKVGKRKFFLTTFFLLIIFSVIFIYYLLLPPKTFPINSEVEIISGATVEDVAELMKEKGFVRSKSIFYLYFVLFEDATTIKASIYAFSEPLTVPNLASELTLGNYSHNLIKFTHIEGETVEEMAVHATEVLPNFNPDNFVDKAKDLEGKLFPDTYMVPVTYNEEELLNLLLQTFDEKLEPLKEKIDDHNLSLDQIIILASILEREANSGESMGMVSGILQNRMRIGMPLQADASIGYVLDKPLSQLTAEDLKIESPYNTYLNVGLPPTPIGNPGLEAITAVLEPTETEYLFYITGDDGNFYYAKTFEEHKRNIANHLR